MKAQDYIITRNEYNNSPVNKGGIFLPPLGVLKDFGVVDTQKPTDVELDKIFGVYWQAAFDDINAFNPDRPLNSIQYLDLQNAKADSVITDATILQVNELTKNGLTELKNSDINSTGAFTSTINPNTRIVSPDQLSQDVEDKLQEVDYREWRLVYDGDQLTVTLRGERLIIAKTANMIALSSLVYEGLDNQDNIFWGAAKILTVINSELSKSRAFKGTWNAPDRATIANIDNEFSTNGLPLTDGTTILTPSNTNGGDTILVTISSDATFLPEELVFDGTNWILITNNNTEKEDISVIKQRLDAIETQLAANTTQIELNKNEIASNKTASDSKDVQQDSLIQQNSAQITSATPERQANTEGRILWEDERAEYVRISDISGAVSIPLNNQAITDNSGILEIDLSGFDLTNLRDGIVASIKLAPTLTSGQTNSIFIRDSFNDGSTQPNTILGNTTAKVKIIPTLATIEDLTPQERSTIINDYTAVLIEQLPSNVAGLDQAARQLATTAQQTANNALLQAAAASKKQLVQGTTGDFETFPQLKALIAKGDNVAITLAAGELLTGRVTDSGASSATDPIKVVGIYFENNVAKIGEITLSDTFDVIGGTDFAGSIDDIQRRAFVKSDGTFIGLSSLAESNNPGNDPELRGATQGYVDKQKKDFKDITATYKTRDFFNDIGKKIRVNNGFSGVINGGNTGGRMFVSFYDITTDITKPSKSFYKGPSDTYPFYTGNPLPRMVPITKFEIEEV